MYQHTDGRENPLKLVLWAGLWPEAFYGSMEEAVEYARGQERETGWRCRGIVAGGRRVMFDS